MKVLVIGTWHLGSVVGTCLAEAGNDVYLWDQDSKIAESWKNGKSPVFENGLDPLIQKNWKERLHWAEDFNQISGSADWIIFAYDTPIDEQDRVQLRAVEQGVEKLLAGGLKPDCRVLFTCQLPVGTSRGLIKKLSTRHPEWKSHAGYMPENLRLGQAIASFTKPDRIVLGWNQEVHDERQQLTQEFQKLAQLESIPAVTVQLESAEMVKHALNAFLGTCIVFANEISSICEQKGADAWEVMASLKQDSRVGPKAFLSPGLGFAGGTIGRDLQILRSFDDQNIFGKIYDTNSERGQWIVDRLDTKLGGLKGKTVVLLGVTYKPGTSTVRRSPAIEIGARIKKLGGQCRAIDPKADLTELSAAERETLPFELKTSAKSAFEGADAAAVITAWPEFLSLEWSQVPQWMKGNVLVDSANLLAKTTVPSQLEVIVPGKP